MSKHIKKMVMDDLKKTFRDVRDMVLLTGSGIDCTTENQLRLALRKKNIRLQMLKNSLARRVFDELKISVGEVWQGPTVLAWGAGSIAELSKEIEAIIKKNKKLQALQAKGAVSEGLAITFEQALKMPTKAEAIGRVVALALSPASRLAGQLRGPGGQIAGQIKTLSEKKPEEAAPAAAG